jgi:hypothetical protein
MWRQRRATSRRLQEGIGGPRYSPSRAHRRVQRERLVEPREVRERGRHVQLPRERAGSAAKALKRVARRDALADRRRAAIHSRYTQEHLAAQGEVVLRAALRRPQRRGVAVKPAAARADDARLGRAPARARGGQRSESEAGGRAWSQTCRVCALGAFSRKPRGAGDAEGKPGGQKWEQCGLRVHADAPIDACGEWFRRGACCRLES